MDDEVQPAADGIVDDVASSRFLHVEDGHEAELVYRAEEGRLVLVHTGVPDELGGRGLGGRLVARRDRARRSHRRDGRAVVPVRPEVAPGPPRRGGDGHGRLDPATGALTGPSSANLAARDGPHRAPRPRPPRRCHGTCWGGPGACPDARARGDRRRRGRRAAPAPDRGPPDHRCRGARRAAPGRQRQLARRVLAGRARPSPPTIPVTDADWDAMAARGFSVVRLLITWSRVEPTRDVIDEALPRPARRSRPPPPPSGASTRSSTCTRTPTRRTRPRSTRATCPPGTSPARGWDGAPAWAVRTDGLSTCLTSGDRNSSPAVTGRGTTSTTTSTASVPSSSRPGPRSPPASRAVPRSPATTSSTSPRCPRPAAELQPLYDQFVADVVDAIRAAEAGGALRPPGVRRARHPGRQPGLRHRGAQPRVHRHEHGQRGRRRPQLRRVDPRRPHHRAAQRRLREPRRRARASPSGRASTASGAPTRRRWSGCSATPPTRTGGPGAGRGGSGASRAATPTPSAGTGTRWCPTTAPRCSSTSSTARATSTSAPTTPSSTSSAAATRGRRPGASTSSQRPGDRTLLVRAHRDRRRRRARRLDPDRRRPRAPRGRRGPRRRPPARRPRRPDRHRPGGGARRLPARDRPWGRRPDRTARPASAAAAPAPPADPVTAPATYAG